MERRLNSRGALIAAWSIVGLMVAGAAGFALFLVLPTGSGDAAVDVEVLPNVTVAALASATPASGRAAFSGTLEKIEGQALVVTTNNEPARVLVRNGAPVGTVRSGSAADLRSGDVVLVTVRRSGDGRPVAERVLVQLGGVPTPTPAGEQRPGGSSFEPLLITGTVTAVESRSLRLRTERGEQAYELSSSARVLRFTPIAFSDLRPGQRIFIDGERLVDGTIAALSVQVFDSR